MLQAGVDGRNGVWCARAAVQAKVAYNCRQVVRASQGESVGLRTVVERGWKGGVAWRLHD
jgi:hypothetical protein